MSIIETRQKEIGGRQYTVRIMSFSEAQPVYKRIERILSVNPEVVEGAGIGLFMLSSLSGGLSEEDLKFCIERFGPTTTVALNATQVLDLATADKRNIVFAQRFEEHFEWLDFCVEVNFEGTIAKMRAAAARHKAAAESKKAQS